MPGHSRRRQPGPPPPPRRLLRPRLRPTSLSGARMVAMARLDGHGDADDHHYHDRHHRHLALLQPRWMGSNTPQSSSKSTSSTSAAAAAFAGEATAGLGTAAGFFGWAAGRRGSAQTTNTPHSPTHRPGQAHMASAADVTDGKADCPARADRWPLTFGAGAGLRSTCASSAFIPGGAAVASSGGGGACKSIFRKRVARCAFGDLEKTDGGPMRKHP